MISSRLSTTFLKASPRFPLAAGSSKALGARLLSTTQTGYQEKPAPYLLRSTDGFAPFVRSNPRTPKPRSTGVTEIRGPYYSAYGKRHLQDVLETMGYHVDGLKFAGGSFSLVCDGWRRRQLVSRKLTDFPDA